MDFQYKTFKDFLCLQIALTQSIVELEKLSFFQMGQNFTRNLLVILQVSYAGKNAYNAGKTNEFLTGGASRAKRCNMQAHCAPSPHWA